MSEKEGQLIVSEKIVISKIYFIRNKKVMLDRDLASLYGVETRILNQAVKRNFKRFPKDFMFQLTKEEFDNWKSQIVISKGDKMGLRKLPLVFTEQGVSMLSSVLNSEQAIMVNIHIIRIFTKMRELISSHGDILQKLEQLRQSEIEQDKKIKLIFEYLNKLEQINEEKSNLKNRKRIGYKISN